jgi:predicted alpha/beta superfamily hydrolase
MSRDQDHVIRASAACRLGGLRVCRGPALRKLEVPIVSIERACLSALILVLAACGSRSVPQSPPASAAISTKGVEPAAVESAVQRAASAPPRLQIANSEIIELASKETGRSYELIVGVPDSYASEPERKYPVLYLLDGQWDFALVNALTGGLRYDKVVPEFFVVGISYGGDKPDYGKLRREDYTPTRWQSPETEQPSGGDGPKFLRCLESEILPAIEGRYRVDTSQRTLAGASAGGLFSLYALFERPELFQSIVALSPAVGWDNRYLFAREKEFRKRQPKLKTRVWLSVGSEEWPEYEKNDHDFFAQFQASRYEGIALRVSVIEGERHAGNKPEAYNRALRFVFEPWAATQKQD